MIAVEADEILEHPTCAVIGPVPTFDKDAITDRGRRQLVPEAEAFSDGLGIFHRFAAIDHAHAVLETDGGCAATIVVGARWCNVILSHLERSIGGAYRAFMQCRYVQRHLAEAACRFSRRSAWPSSCCDCSVRLVLSRFCVRPRIFPAEVGRQSGLRKQNARRDQFPRCSAKE